MKTTKRFFITSIVLVIVIFVFTTTAYRISHQLGPEMEFQLNSLALSPTGIYYVQYPCSFLERIMIRLFYMGEEIHFDSISPPNNGKQQQSRYYHVRNRDDLGVIYRKEFMNAILRASSFCTFCIDYSVAHSEIFAQIMASMYNCSESDDIEYICVETYDEENGKAHSKLLITEHSLIDEVWKILNRGIYYHDSGKCKDEANSEQPIDVATVKSNGTMIENGRMVTLVFPDGSNFCFSLYHPKERVLLIETSNLKGYVTEYLHLTEEDNARLIEIFGLSVSNEVP